MAEEGNTAQRVVVSALRRRSTGVNNRQVVTSGVEFDRLFNVAVVCNARELVCSSVSPVCFDFPLSCRLKNAVTWLGRAASPPRDLLIIVSKGCC